MQEREDRYDVDDTEYHFSDEEVNYEMDAAETPKAAPVTPEANRVSGGSSILQSRRMLISGGVFFVLVFVVYKMVTPSVSSDITVNDAEMKSVPVLTQNAPAANTAQGYSAKATVNKTSAPSANAPAMAMQDKSVTPSMPVIPTTPANYAEQPQQPAAQPTVADVSSYMRHAPVQPMQTMPSMPVMASNDGFQTYAVPGANATDSKVAGLAAQNQRLMEQLQKQYDERIQDYQNQNKTLQNQVQMLNSKVEGMENKLSEVLSTHEQKQDAGNTSASAKTAAPEPDFASAQPMRQQAPKIPYNVQAIIPGRAWLKSDNGETITVAEGDMVKSVGRITKIDPYDGIVEINTGKHVVALSYGDSA